MIWLEDLVHHTSIKIGSLYFSLIVVVIVFAIILLVAFIDTHFKVRRYKKRLEKKIIEYIRDNPNDPYFNTEGVRLSSLFSVLFDCEPYDYYRNEDQHMFHDLVEQLVNRGQLMYIKERIFYVDNTK